MINLVQDPKGLFCYRGFWRASESSKMGNESGGETFRVWWMAEIKRLLAMDWGV
jgi:hypothetical protein